MISLCSFGWAGISLATLLVISAVPSPSGFGVHVGVFLAFAVSLSEPYQNHMDMNSNF